MASPSSATQHRIATASASLVALIGAAGIIWVIVLLSSAALSFISSACLIAIVTLSLPLCLFGVCTLVFAIVDNPCLL